MDAFLIDAFEFCRQREAREGELHANELPRLAQELVEKEGHIRWRLTGGFHPQGYPQIKMSTSGSVRLLCQRCLSPFDCGFASDSALVLAEDEGSADELDALLADDPVEVVVGGANFDIRQLIEDDVLLNLPSSPRHTFCPEPVAQIAEEEVRKESPFAVLKNLKR